MAETRREEMIEKIVEYDEFLTMKFLEEGADSLTRRFWRGCAQVRSLGHTAPRIVWFCGIEEQGCAGAAEHGCIIVAVAAGYPASHWRKSKRWQ